MSQNYTSELSIRIIHQNYPSELSITKLINYFLQNLYYKMNKNTSTVLVAAVAGILVAAALAVTMTNVAFARQSSEGGNGGIGGAGGAGGVAGNGGSNEVEHAGGHNHQSADGGNANGGRGGDANGGNSCNNRCGANS